MTGKSALLIGATGAVGKHVLRELLASKEFTRVGEYGRRVTPKEQFSGIDSSKLEQKTINFESLEDAGLKDGKWDVVFVTYVYSTKLLRSNQITRGIFAQVGNKSGGSRKCCSV